MWSLQERTDNHTLCESVLAFTSPLQENLFFRMGRLLQSSHLTWTWTKFYGLDADRTGWDLGDNDCWKRQISVYTVECLPAESNSNLLQHSLTHTSHGLPWYLHGVWISWANYCLGWSSENLYSCFLGNQQRPELLLLFSSRPSDCIMKSGARPVQLEKLYRQKKMAVEFLIGQMSSSGTILGRRKILVEIKSGVDGKNTLMGHHWWCIDLRMSKRCWRILANVFILESIITLKKVHF